MWHQNTYCQLYRVNTGTVTQCDALLLMPYVQRGLWDTSQVQAFVSHSVSHGFTLSCKLQWKQEQPDNNYFGRWFTSQHKANKMVRVSTPGNERWFDPSTGKRKPTLNLTKLIQVARTDLCYCCQVMLWRCSGKMHKLNLKLNHKILWGVPKLVEFSKVWMHTSQKLWNCCHWFPALAVETLKNWVFILSVSTCPRIRNVFLDS